MSIQQVAAQHVLLLPRQTDVHYCHLTLRKKPKSMLYIPDRVLIAHIWSRASLYLLSSSFSALKLRTVQMFLTVWVARSLFWAWQSWIWSFSSCSTKNTDRFTARRRIWSDWRTKYTIDSSHLEPSCTPFTQVSHLPCHCLQFQIQ